MHDLLIDDRDAFAEILRIQIDLLQDHARFQLLPPQPGVALKSGAFVQESGTVFQPFGERIGIVWIYVDHAIAVLGRLCRKSKSRGQRAA